MKMLRIGYSELRYLDTMKTLCNMLNRMFESKGLSKKTRSIVRDVEYGSGKYHYTEKIGDIVIYSIGDKSPLSMIKQIAERANEKIY